jgi:F-type H+-transporting ATPase subunit b
VLSFHPQIFIIQWITFVLGMAAIWAMYLKPLGKHLKGRREGIIKDLASAEAARAEGQKLKSEFALEKVKLAEENHRLMEKTKADAEAFRSELMAKAKDEHESLLKAGRKQLDQERLEALRQIRQEAAELVVLATAKLLEKNLGKAAQLSLAQKFVKSVKVSKN